MNKEAGKDEPNYIGVVLPKIFDLDEYLESIGFKESGNYYAKGNKRILIENEYFCCLIAEDEPGSGTEIQTIMCQLAYLPDVWLINILLYQIGFIKNYINTMRLDHIAYRVKDRHATADFFIKAFGYRIAEDLPEGFDIQFEDGTSAKCLVLLPPEQITGTLPWISEVYHQGYVTKQHMAPEIFISDGSSGSVVKEWVEQRNGVGGIHHLAYQVDSVEDKVEEMKSLGYFEFTTEEPLKCPGLTQIFTKPSSVTGIIYEFITREKEGFCKDNVKDLMNSTKNINK